MKNELNSVYALADPITKEVRYVGCTVNVRERYLFHVANAEGSEAKREWIGNLLERELLPTLIILEGSLPKPIALDREKYWTAWYASQGARLTNGRIPLLIPMETRNEKVISQLKDMLMEWREDGCIDAAAATKALTLLDQIA